MLNRVWIQNSEELHFTGQGVLSAFDESIERLFSYELKHSVDVAKERLHDLLIYLAKDSKADITFNHVPCKVSEHLAGPVAIVQNHPNGFIIRLARDPKISSTYKGGLVMYDGKLRKFARMLKDTAFKQLSRGIVYTHDEIQTLVCEAIPNINKSIPVFKQPKIYPKPLNPSLICSFKQPLKNMDKTVFKVLKSKQSLSMVIPSLQLLSMVP